MADQFIRIVSSVVYYMTKAGVPRKLISDACTKLHVSLVCAITLPEKARAEIVTSTTLHNWFVEVTVKIADDGVFLGFMAQHYGISMLDMELDYESLSLLTKQQDVQYLWIGRLINAESGTGIVYV